MECTELTILMDLSELEGCSWLLFTAALSLSVVTTFLALNLGTVMEGRRWQEILIAIGLSERAVAGFGREKGGEVVNIAATANSFQ